MRLAIITDIHENFQMLEKMVPVLEQHGYDQLVCLGDITGYSPMFYEHTPDANACIDFVRQNVDVAVAGNHDLFTSKRLASYHQKKDIPDHWYDLNYEQQLVVSKNKLWLYEDEQMPDLTPGNREFLENLNEWAVISDNDQNYLFTHFFNPDMAGISRWFPSTVFEIRTHFQFMKEKNCSLSFTGHSHPLGPVLINRFSWQNAGYHTTSIRSGHRAVICPSLAGGRTKGCFLIVDTQKKIIQPVMIH
jgi:predicted phosphodiesterase